MGFARMTPALEPLKLRPFQKADVKAFLREPTRAGLNGSITGVGKTLVGVEIMRKALQRPLAPYYRPPPSRNARARPVAPSAPASGIVLIVGPLNTWDGWRDTVLRQTGNKVMRLGAPSTTPPELLPEINLINIKQGKPGWYFTGWDFFLRLTVPIIKHVDHIIYDEIHRASNRKAATSHHVWAVSKHIAEKGGYIHEASATAFGNKPEGGWSVGKSMWPLKPHTDEFGSFWRWVDRHLERKTKKLETSRGIQVVEEVGRELEVGSIVGNFPMYIRHEAHERCCKFHPHGAKADLPPRVIHRVPITLSPEQVELYAQLEAVMLAWIKEKEWPIDSDGWPMVNYTRMVQVCLAAPTTELKRLLKKDAPPEQIIKVTYPLNTKSTKIDILLDILSDIDETERVLIFTHSAGIIPVLIDRIKKELKIPKGDQRTVQAWFGETKAQDRDRIKDEFMQQVRNPDGEKPVCRIIVAQIDAIGHGTDGLQRVCWNEIWFSPSGSMVSNIQGAGRLNRDGQTHPVNVWEIYAKGTVEEDQFARLDRTASVMQDTLRAIPRGKKKHRGKSGSKIATPVSKTPAKKKQGEKHKRRDKGKVKK